jgi:predicted PurR-regulated permease PerM
LIFFANGAFVKGLILLGVGSLVIGLVDNLLRPLLVGRDTHMPDYVVLLVTLGGLTVFGMSGLVIGPIIGALSLTVWEMFEQEHRNEDMSRNVDDEVEPVVKE